MCGKSSHWWSQARPVCLELKKALWILMVLLIESKTLLLSRLNSAVLFWPWKYKCWGLSFPFLFFSFLSYSSSSSCSSLSPHPVQVHLCPVSLAALGRHTCLCTQAVEATVCVLVPTGILSGIQAQNGLYIFPFPGLLVSYRPHAVVSNIRVRGQPMCSKYSSHLGCEEELHQVLCPATVRLISEDKGEE